MKRTWSYLFSFALLILPVVPAVAQAGTPAVCLIGEHPDILESDAQTAALLVCDELHKQGISVTDPGYEAPVSGYVYRVVLRRLGEKIVMRLSYENPIGAIIAEQQLTLANIEEMIPAAPRLVDALVHDKPIDDTVDMEPVTEQEARELRKISGESLWHIEIFRAFFPGANAAPELGLGWGWSHQTPSYAVGADVRLTGRIFDPFSSRDRVGCVSLGIGGCSFLNKQKTSPYVGGGLTLIVVSYGRFLNSEGAGGLGAYGVAGVEVLRHTQIRLNLELRIDRTFFSLPSREIMPITFGISFSF